MVELFIDFCDLLFGALQYQNFSVASQGTPKQLQRGQQPVFIFEQQIGTACRYGRRVEDAEIRY